MHLTELAPLVYKREGVGSPSLVYGHCEAGVADSVLLGLFEDNRLD